MEKDLFTGVNMEDSLFLCIIDQNPLILCEEHARTFELVAITAGTPHSIIEFEDPEDEEEPHKCQACNLIPDALNSSSIILLH